MTFVGTLFYLHVQSPLPPEIPLAPRLAGSPPVRVLWILFDEWDQRLNFPNRAPGTLLPTIDSLANRSFTATRALAVQAGMPVEQMTTLDAIPSLLYGKRLVRSSIEGAGTRHLDFAGGASAVFGGGESIFAHVRSRGWNSAVVQREEQHTAAEYLAPSVTLPAPAPVEEATKPPVPAPPATEIRGPRPTQTGSIRRRAAARLCLFRKSAAPATLRPSTPITA